MIKRHLFLTGQKQVGKSTLLRLLIQQCGLDCGGFETRPLLINGERRGFYLHALSDVSVFQQDAVISVRLAQRLSVPVPEAFEQNGVAVLNAALTDSHPYVLMDEIGRLESRSAGFCTAVLSVLDGLKPVIGVLQDCQSDLVQQIKSRPDVQVIDVTPDNRDTLLPDLVAFIEKQTGV